MKMMVPVLFQRCWATAHEAELQISTYCDLTKRATFAKFCSIIIIVVLRFKQQTIYFTAKSPNSSSTKLTIQDSCHSVVAFSLPYSLISFS